MKPIFPSPVWIRRFAPHETLLVEKLRAETYRTAGKVADGSYQSEFDPYGEVYLVGRGPETIGTFSLVDMGAHPRARLLLARRCGIPASRLRNALYVYFLGIEARTRSPEALKAVFGEVFRRMAETRREEIFVLADDRLARRYRWIGFAETGLSAASAFPKAGPLRLLRTRQVRAGLYGLHADPLRWNWYLKEISASLLAEGRFPRPRRQLVLFLAYRSFAPLARLAELVAHEILRRENGKPRPKDIPHVRPI